MPLTRVLGQRPYAFVDHADGGRGRLCLRQLPGLLVLAVLIVLVPLAHASPPDPVWIEGAYDAADYDDVVAAVTSLDSTRADGWPVIDKPVSLLLGILPVAGAPIPDATVLRSIQPRAPPNS